MKSKCRRKWHTVNGITGSITHGIKGKTFCKQKGEANAVTLQNRKMEK